MFQNKKALIIIITLIVLLGGVILVLVLSNKGDKSGVESDPETQSSLEILKPAGAGTINNSNLPEVPVVTDISKFSVGKLVDGREILRVPQEYLSREPFKTSMNDRVYVKSDNDGDATELGGIFIFDKSSATLEFAGNSIGYLSDFTYENKSYWVALRYFKNNLYPLVILYEPEFINPRTINLDTIGVVNDIAKVSTQQGVYVVYVPLGNGRSSKTETYEIDLKQYLKNTTNNVVTKKLE
jgi:hypothetical protein